MAQSNSGWCYDVLTVAPWRGNAGDQVCMSMYHCTQVKNKIACCIPRVYSRFGCVCVCQEQQLHSMGPGGNASYNVLLKAYLSSKNRGKSMAAIFYSKHMLLSCAGSVGLAWKRVVVFMQISCGQSNRSSFTRGVMH